MAYEANGNYPAACDDYSTVLTLNADKAYHYFDRGRIKQKMGRYREALEDFDTSIVKNPILARAYYAKAMLLASCPDDAIRDGGGSGPVRHSRMRTDKPNEATPECAGGCLRRVW
jgi:tetratricopeptide (TPR) repeat protein